MFLSGAEPSSPSWREHQHVYTSAILSTTVIGVYGVVEDHGAAPWVSFSQAAPAAAPMPRREARRRAVKHDSWCQSVQACWCSLARFRMETSAAAQSVSLTPDTAYTSTLVTVMVRPGRRTWPRATSSSPRASARNLTV